jgi:uncharacterized protein YegJ (DUF2314 family)
MSLPRCLCLALLALLAGCRDRATARRAPADDAAAAATLDAAAAPAPLGPVRVGPAHAVFFVYTAAGVDGKAAAERAIAAEKELRLAPAPADGGALPAVSVAEPAVSEVPIPGPEHLQHFSAGLTPAETAQAAAAGKVVVLAFEHSAETANAAIARAHRVTGAIARATRGLVWSDDARLLYGQDAWAERTRGAAATRPMIAELTHVHAYQPGDAPVIRLVTLGMGTFGLPDLVIDDMPPGFHDEARALLAIVGQLLLEGAQPDAAGDLAVRLDALVDADGKPLTPFGEGGTGTASVRLVTATPAQGDPDNRLWAITFPGDGALAERQGAVLQGLLGRNSRLHGVEKDDPELAAVTREVQAGLRALQKRFAKRSDREQLQVKAGFATADDNTEYMWIDVQTWTGDTLRGVLLNEPRNVPDLAMGARVEVEEKAIVDARYVKADGTVEGGKSNDILERRMNAAP